MCGRFGQYNLPVETIRKIFQLTEIPELQLSYNVAPTDDALTIGTNPDSDNRSAQYLRWGLIPFWSDGPDHFSSDLINARAETVAEKPAFRKQLYSQRCVVPINGFYEWKETGDGKQPYWIYPSSTDFFGLAGLWDAWSDDESDKTVHSFTIITTDANEKMNDLHDRMPVILSENEYDTWLDTDEDDLETLEQLLDPSDNDAIDFHQVSKVVNNPSYDEEKCVEPIE